MCAATVAASAAVGQYAGAAVAVEAFAATGPAALGWTRNLVAAIVLASLFRPALIGWTRPRLVRVTAFGITTVLTNVFFYEAIARIPMGVATAVEFCGPVAVGLIAARSRYGYLAGLLCAAGVACLGGVTGGGEAGGFAFAAAAAVCFAGRLVLTARIAEGSRRRQDLAAGLVIAVALFAPLATTIPGDLMTPGTLAQIVVVGALSTVVPYLLDQVTARIVGPSGLAVLAGLLPVVAAVTGFVALGQVLSVVECLGIALVCVAVITKALDPAGGRRPRP